MDYLHIVYNLCNGVDAIIMYYKFIGSYFTNYINLIAHLEILNI